MLSMIEITDEYMSLAVDEKVIVTAVLDLNQ
jgi:hypothetical protein